MDPIFVKTRYFYQSYTDFWDLVRLSGFPSCFVNEMDIYSDNTYIVCPMNGEMLDFMGEDKRLGRTARILQWNLERPSGSGGLAQYKASNQALVQSRYFDDIIVSDRALAEQCDFHFVPVGSHPDLGHPGEFEEKQFDFVHLSAYTGGGRNRCRLFENPEMQKEFIGNRSIAPRGWGKEKDLSLKRSRYMLNVHQDEFQYIEPLRFALAAAYGLPVISEDCLDFYPYEQIVVFKELEDLFSEGSIYDRFIYDHGLEFRYIMTEKYNFRKWVEVAL